MTRPIFLLVHGAFRGGWAWSRVVPGLSEAGYEAHAPSLPGSGERAHEVDDVLTLQDWVDDLQALVESVGLDDLVLVGHSQGGLVTTALAARIPDRTRLLVHLDAAVPRPGERAVDLGPSGFPLPARGTSIAPRPPVVGAEYDAGTVEWMSPLLSPTPVGPSLDPMPSVPATVHQRFYFCEGTPQGYPSTVTRARMDELGAPYEVLDASHDAPITSPHLVVATLLDCVG